MTASLVQFNSDTGFKSPNFSVTTDGQLSLTGSAVITEDITVTGTIFANTISFGDADRNVNIVERIPNENTYQLSPQITRVGILDFLEIEGDFLVGKSSTNYLQIDDGTVRINSLERGGIQNMDIGTVEPADAAFLQVDIGSADSTGGRLGIIGNVFVSDGDVAVTDGNVTVVNGDINSDNLIANETPVEPYHVTRKDYVDARISAFSIAFGA